MFCAAIALIACFDLPMGYYTFLRIVLPIGSIVIFSKEIQKQLTVYGLAFLSIAILFNPILPIYLNHKSNWLPIDIITGILFLLYGFKEKNKN